MKKAYSYVRMSTEVQRHGDSSRRQLEMSANYARQHGLQLQTYEDIGVSAFKGANVSDGALGKFLALVNEGKVEKGSYLLVESFDRLSRDRPTAALRLFLNLIEKGIVVVTLADGQIYSDETTDAASGGMQLMMSLSIMHRAHEESRMKSQRLLAVWKNKRDSLNEKKLTSVAPGWLRLAADGKTFEVIKDRADLIKKIFEYSRDGIGSGKIARLLNKENTPSWGKSKNGWHISFIYKLLSERAVLGEFVPLFNKKKKLATPIQNYYPRVITDELYYAAQKARVARLHKGGRKGSNFPNLFANVVRCGYCHQPVHHINKGKPPKGGRYLRCYSSIRAHGCTAPAWDYFRFERNFLALVSEIDLRPMLANLEATQKAESLNNRLTAVDGLIGEQLKRQSRLLAAIEDGGSEAPAAAMARLKDLESELSQLNLEKKRLEIEISRVDASAEDVLDKQAKIRSIKEMLDAPDEEQQFRARAKLAQLIAGTVSAIYLYPSGRIVKPGRSEAFFSSISQGLSADDIQDLDRVKAVMSDEDELAGSFKRCYLVQFKDDGYRFVKPHAHLDDQFEYMMVDGTFLRDDSLPAIGAG